MENIMYNLKFNRQEPNAEEFEEKERYEDEQKYSNAWQIILHIGKKIDSDLERLIKENYVSFIKEEDKKLFYLKKNERLVLEGCKIVVETKSKDSFVHSINKRKGLIMQYLDRLFGKDKDSIEFETKHLCASLAKIYEKFSEFMNVGNLIISDNGLKIDSQEVLNMSSFIKNCVRVYRII